jgi:hypothetical protein
MRKKLSMLFGRNSTQNYLLALNVAISLSLVHVALVYILHNTLFFA